MSTLQLWMLQCHWHWSIHNCRVDSTHELHFGCNIHDWNTNAKLYYFGASYLSCFTLSYPLAIWTTILTKIAQSVICQRYLVWRINANWSILIWRFLCAIQVSQQLILYGLLLTLFGLLTQICIAHLSGGVGGAVRFLVVGTISQEERPPRGQLWMEQCLTSLKYWPI